MTDDPEADAIRAAICVAVLNYRYRKPRKKKSESTDDKKPDDGSET